MECLGTIIDEAERARRCWKFLSNHPEELADYKVILAAMIGDLFEDDEGKYSAFINQFPKIY
jgi:hypothetical protein